MSVAQADGARKFTLEGRWIATAKRAASFVLAASLFATFHPYIGIAGDAALYLGRAQADLDPSGVGRDIAFANDGQSRFSLFSRVLDPLVAVCGPSAAGMIVAMAASACVLGAAYVLARALTGDKRLMFAIVAAVAVLPTTYGNDSFHFAEAAFLPRPFAEASVVVAVAALLAGRRLLAAPFLLAALLIHPLMAMAGIGVVAVLLAWRRTIRASFAVVAAYGVAAALAFGLGALGVPLFDRLLVRVDPEWLAMLTQRSPYLFPSLWSATAFVAPVVHLTTIASAARRGGPMRRRVLAAVAISAVLQIIAAAVLGDSMHVLLMIQAQGWRATWLLAFAASACLPLVARELWREGPQARVVLALLGSSWLCGIGLPATIISCGLALVLQQKRMVLPLLDRHAKWALACAAVIVSIDAAASTIAWVRLAGRAPDPVAVFWFGSLRAGIAAVPICSCLIVWLLAVAPRRSLSSLAMLVALATLGVASAAATWDARATADVFFGKQDGFGLANVPGDHSSEVMVFGGLSQAWFTLGRAQYFSPQQASGIVFSRPLAMEFRRRAAVLRSTGLIPASDVPVLRERPSVTAAKLAVFCRRDDAPAAVVVPDLVDAPAPVLSGATTWTPPAPLPFIESFDPLESHSIRRWIVAPCAATLPTSELAKTGGR